MNTSYLPIALHHHRDTLPADILWIRSFTTGNVHHDQHGRITKATGSDANGYPATLTITYRSDGRWHSYRLNAPAKAMNPPPPPSPAGSPLNNRIRWRCRRT
jgi:hypothetical protein